MVEAEDDTAGAFDHRPLDVQADDVLGALPDGVGLAIAKLTMCKDLPAFDNAVIGFGAGLFFWGYFLLEIPGALMVEKWSARKTIFRIMVIWGFMAALTAAVK